MSHPLLTPKPLCPFCNEVMHTYTTDKEYRCEIEGCIFSNVVITKEQHEKLCNKFELDKVVINDSINKLTKQIMEDIAVSLTNYHRGVKNILLSREQ